MQLIKNIGSTVNATSSNILEQINTNHTHKSTRNAVASAVGHCKHGEIIQLSNPIEVSAHNVFRSK